jgi:hypothetical protein
MSETDAVDAIELAATAGITLAPGEQEALSAAMARDDGRWVQPRVNCGYSDVILARELAGLFLLDERILHVCPSRTQAGAAFERLYECVAREPELSRRVTRASKAAGMESLRTQAGGEIWFPSVSGSRGVSADLIVLSGGTGYDNRVLTAVLPCSASRPDPQVWVTGT